MQVTKCWLVTRNHTLQELHPCVDEVPAPFPTIVPSSSSRTVSTRTVGAKAKQGQEISLQFNLCNEPWLKYTLSVIADGGLKPSQWTSSRLHDEVLLLETTGCVLPCRRTQHGNTFYLLTCFASLD